ncbi:MAG: hypothetical protein AAGN82_29965 [Myxococcota bacterium]
MRKAVGSTWSMVALAMACGGETSASGDAATGGAGGAGGEAALVASSATSTGAGSITTIAATGGTGGGPPGCAGVTVDPGPYDDEFAYVCEWGRDETDCPVAYVELAGQPGASVGVVEACLDFFDSGNESALRIELPDGLAVGTYPELEFKMGIYATRGTVEVMRVDAMGGRVQGSFEGICAQLDQAMPCAATFDVLRVAPLARP